jgi:hypothetical protein
LLIEVPANLGAAQIPNIANYNLYGAEVKMVGWGQNSQMRVDSKLKVGTLKVLTYEECLQRIRTQVHDAVFDVREALCTKGNPYVIMTDVSIYNFKLLYVLIKKNLLSILNYFLYKFL